MFYGGLTEVREGCRPLSFTLLFYYDVNDALGHGDGLYYLLALDVLLCLGCCQCHLHHLLGSCVGRGEHRETNLAIELNT